MEVLIIIIPFALLISIVFLWTFIKAAKGGQFDDLDTPAYRILLDDNKLNTKHEEKK